MEAALLWVTPCCHSAPTILKGQREGDETLILEGGGRWNGEIPVISPEVLDSKSGAALQWLQGEIPCRRSMGWAVAVQEVQNQLGASPRRADAK